MQLLVNLMFTDIYPVCNQLFDKTYLRSRKVIKTLTTTLRDYYDNVFNGYLYKDFLTLLYSTSLTLVEAAYLQ